MGYQLGRKIKKRKITENKCVCETCGKGFANNYRLNRHIRQVHENPKSNYTPRKDGPSEKQQALECQDIFFDESTAKWVCRLCGKQTTRPGHMMRHVNQVHYKTICAVCDICGMEFTDRNSLKRHKLKHEGYSIECHYCLKKFQTKWKKMEHVKRHHPLEYAQEIIIEPNPRKPSKYDCFERFQENEECKILTTSN